jgi:hypothetical protein
VVCSCVCIVRSSWFEACEELFITGCALHTPVPDLFCIKARVQVCSSFTAAFDNRSMPYISYSLLHDSLHLFSQCVWCICSAGPSIAHIPILQHRAAAQAGEGQGCSHWASPAVWDSQHGASSACHITFSACFQRHRVPHGPFGKCRRLFVRCCRPCVAMRPTWHERVCVYYQGHLYSGMCSYTSRCACILWQCFCHVVLAVLWCVFLLIACSSGVQVSALLLAPCSHWAVGRGAYAVAKLIGHWNSRVVVV